MENTPKPYNPAARIALYCWLGMIIGIVLIFYPFIFDPETYGLGPAMIFVGLIIFFTFLISGIIFTRMANNFKAMIDGKDLLAHWTYSKEEWDKYTEAEHIRNRKEKWGLFRFIAIIAIIVGIGFAIFNHDALPVMLIVIPALIVLIAFVAFLSITTTYRRNRNHLGEVYIGRRGAIFQHTLHYWKLPETYLQSVKFFPGDEPYLEIGYSGQSGMARANYTARIPVPGGRENEAVEIVKILSPEKKNNEVI
jgi:hypothetical protein